MWSNRAELQSVTVFQRCYSTFIQPNFQRLSSHSRMEASLRQAASEGPGVRGSAFAMAFRFVSRSTVAYRLVVLMLECPSQWLIVTISTPACSRWTAVLWRMLCG